MSISSPLDISWTHAYWTEGPEFTAVAPPMVGQGLLVGKVPLGVGGDPLVALWPDEVGTADLTQATDANKPYYTPSSADMGGKPTIYTPAPDKRFLSVDWTDIPQPFEVVAVARFRSTGGGSGRPIVAGVVGAITQFGGGFTSSSWGLTLNGVGSGIPTSGGTRDAVKHLFRLVADATDTLFVDEASVASAANGTNSMLGLTVGSSEGGASGTPSFADYCFVGVVSGTLSAGNRTDLHAWAQAHYGVA